MSELNHIPADTTAEEYLRTVAEKSADALQHVLELQSRAQPSQSTPSASSTSSIPSTSTPVGLDQSSLAALAQIVTQTLRQQPPSVVQPSTHSPVPAALRSEKLPDIAEYEGDKDRLDAWEQMLIQRIDVNDDRYPTDRAKIAYAESRLTIGKKAHNLMGQYRVNGLYIIESFQEWRQKLRHCCRNPFESEDARTYLRKTLKQGSMSFTEYYNLFYDTGEQ